MAEKKSEKQSRKYDEKQKEATIKYLENNFDRIQFRVRKGKKAKIQELAKSMGLSVNALLENLIDEIAAIQGFDMDVPPTPSQQKKRK